VIEPLVFENPPHDEFDPIVLFSLLVIAVALGSLPAILLPNGLIWSISIWSVAVFVITVGFWLNASRKLKSVDIENDGIGLHFSNGKYRNVDWQQVMTIKPVEGNAAWKWVFVAFFPFVYGKDDTEEEKEGLLLLRDGSKYRISWTIAEAIHTGYHETTGRWPI
jgi:hypothetical protein